MNARGLLVLTITACCLGWAAGASAQDMAMAMAMYPQVKPALDKMRAEGGKMPPGTAILTEMGLAK